MPKGICCICAESLPRGQKKGDHEECTTLKEKGELEGFNLGQIRKARDAQKHMKALADWASKSNTKNQKIKKPGIWV